VATVLAALDKRRTGLAPAVVLGALVALVLLIAVARAAASSRGEHRGLCFLSKLGVNIGPGCGSVAKEQAGKEIEKLLEQTHRVHDIEVEERPGGGRRLLEAWGALAGAGAGGGARAAGLREGGGGAAAAAAAAWGARGGGGGAGGLEAVQRRVA
jgi:hypothetical protein